MLLPDPSVSPKARENREERWREILTLLSSQGKVTVDEIKSRFQVSAVTARNDLNTLASTGKLLRSHGGALTVATTNQNHVTYTDEQTRLAVAALSLIEYPETIMICPGRATTEMARLVRSQCQHKITVVTYSLPIAIQLSEAPQVSLVMLGGIHRQDSSTFVGPHAEHMMKSLHAGHCFLNPAGLCPNIGITGSDIMEADLNQRMIEAATQVTVLAELKSFGSRHLALIATLDRINRIICDAGAPADDVAKLRDRGLNVVLV